MSKVIVVGVALVALLLPVSHAVAVESNKEDVKRRVMDGWDITVWGVIIGDGEYARFTAHLAAAVAAENPGPILQYFEDLARRNLDKVRRDLPGISRDFLWGEILTAMNTGRIRQYDRFDIKAGLATWQRWQTMIYDEPRSRQKCTGRGILRRCWPEVFTERVERKIPLPNWHMPYVSFRFARHNTPRPHHGSNQPVSHNGGARAYDYKFTNNCNKRVRLAIHYKDTNNKWRTEGWWIFRPGESSYLTSSGRRIKSKNSIWYYYAEVVNGRERWSGDHTYSLDGRHFPMKKKRDTKGTNTWAISCR